MIKTQQTGEPNRLHVVFRYGGSGVIIFAFNMLVAAYFFSFKWVIDNDLYTNIANAIATEITFIFSFFLHSYLTWRQDFANLFRRLIRFHLVAAAGLVVRLSLFAIFIHYGLHWLPATIGSIAFQVLLNFIGYDHLVFAPSDKVVSSDGLYELDGAGTTALSTMETATEYNRYVANQIEPSLGKENLELGAGTGTITVILTEKNRVTICEPAIENRKALKKRFSKNKNVGDIQEDFYSFKKKAQFDCIYSSNVLSQIKDDVRVLEHAGKLLKVGGRFTAFVPAGMWLYSDYDRKIGHYRRYTRKDVVRLKNLLRQRVPELALTRSKFLNLPGALGWFIKMKLLRVQAITENDARLAGMLMRFSTFLDRLHLPIGQSMILEFTRTNDG